MRRVSISVRSLKNPDLHCIAQALSQELTGNMIGFFSAQKFPIDEELELTTYTNGVNKSFKIMLTHLREEISSGRIMNALPDENRPFPARTFYKCYGKVLQTQAAVQEPGAEESSALPNAPTAIDDTPPLEAVAEELKAA